MKRIPLEGKRIGEWDVLEYVGDRSYLCECSCGAIKVVSGNLLRRGASLSCGHAKRIDDSEVIGKTFGEWYVLGKAGNYSYLCKCSCGVIKEVNSYHLRYGQSKSCGHNTNKLKDLTGQKFGELTVLEYVGNRRWRCRCSCGKIKDIHSQLLTSGITRSCGCKSTEFLKETLLNKYGDEVPLRAKNPRSVDVQGILTSRSNMLAYLSSFDYKKTITELAEELEVKYWTILTRLKEYGLREYVDINPLTSKIEREIKDYIKSICNKELIEGDRDILSGFEIDLYIPNLKLAIEVNGDYWHSTIKKGKNYHQLKSILAIKNGIRLIHIFEHEWYELINQEKIKKLLNFIVKHDLNKVDIESVEIITEENKLIAVDDKGVICELKYDTDRIIDIQWYKYISNREEIIKSLFDCVCILNNTNKLKARYSIDKFDNETYKLYGLSISKIEGPEIIYKIKDGDVYNSGYYELEYTKQEN